MQIKFYEILIKCCISCNIFSNHFIYPPSPSPSMTTTIYHQHHYHHYYHHCLCHHSFHPAMNHLLLHAMCPLFVSLCDSVLTYSVIVPAEAVWQTDQLHFGTGLQLMASTSKGEQWGLWPLKAIAHSAYPTSGYTNYIWPHLEMDDSSQCDCVYVTSPANPYPRPHPNPTPIPTPTQPPTP